MLNNIDKEFNFLKKIIISDITFLTIKEKIIFEKFLDDFSQKNGFEEMINKLKNISKSEISEIVKRKFPRANWNGEEKFQKALLAKNIINRFSIKSVFYGDKNFPSMLSFTTEVKDPPYSLFYRGNLDVLQKSCISVVGTRHSNIEAQKAAFDFSKRACDDDKTIVSGLALGIDIESHKGALSSARCSTVAVLPSGIDSITPMSNTKYAVKILEKNGLLISEYLPGTPAEKYRFVQRNRIIAALSPSTVVIQAPAGSGAMITANLALDYNREVFIHSANFNEQSKKLDEVVKGNLHKAVLNNEKSQKQINLKIENSPKFFVESGAKIISSYEDFKNIGRF